MERIIIRASKVKCQKCHHEWLYTKGEPKYRVRCPKCHSSKNRLNEELFGKWHP